VENVMSRLSPEEQAGLDAVVARVKARLKAAQRAGRARLPAPAPAARPPLRVVRPSSLPVQPTLSPVSQERQPLWPPAIPGLGPQRVIPYTRCTDCEASGGHLVYEDQLHEDGVRRVAIRIVEGSFNQYGAIPLCLTHARQRLHRVVEEKLASFGTDVEWELE
jgi:hypothetical protein